MISYDIKGLTIKWFEDYLFNIVQMCKTDSQRWSPCPIKCSVPQSSILGLILFLLDFNDFENCLKRSKVINADDNVVFLPGKKHLEKKV